ncbi:hypothetical protein YC2023_032776 [Brassica napus]
MYLKNKFFWRCPQILHHGGHFHLLTLPLLNTNPNKLSKPLRNPIHLFPLHSLNRYLALHALQHRGQEGAGIVTVSKDKVLQTIIGVGLVSEVLNESKLDQLPGDIAIGHVRYSTAGSSLLKNVQPFVPGYRFGSVGVAHNGNLVNYTKLSQCNAFSNTFTSRYTFSML